MKLSTIISTGLLSLATLTSIQPQVANGGFLPNPRGPPRNDHAHAHPHQNHHQHPVAVRQAQLPKKMDQVETVVPSAVVFHDTNVTTTTNTPPNFNSTTNPIVNGTGGGGGGGSGGAAWPQKPQNITACTAPVYEDTSPLRTHIIRDDCHDLARKVLARAGYWEMAQWTTGAAGGNDGQYVGLVSKGTCQFAVSRRLDMKLLHDQGQGGAHYGNFSSVAAGGAVNNNNNTDVAFIGNQDVYNVLHAAVYDFAYASDEPYMDKMTTQGRMYCQFQHAANATLAFELQYVDDDGSD